MMLIKLCFRVSIGCLLAIASLTAADALAMEIEEIEKFVPDHAGHANFGCSVATSGDVAIVGASSDNDQIGAAYVHRFNGMRWVKEQKIVPSDGVLGECFGQAVSICGNVALIGKVSDVRGGYHGAAYVYRFDGASWIEEQKLIASDAAAWDYFGLSVALSGDTAIVGSLASAGIGAAYVFRFDGTDWIEEQRLSPSDGADWDAFGRSVAIQENVALIGSGSDEVGRASGSAYVFRHVGGRWVEEEKLVPRNAREGDEFGVSVALDADVALIGTTRCRWVYFYRFDGASWIEQKATATDVIQSDLFGISVSLSGDTALIGASCDDDGGIEAGAAYLFRLEAGTWVERQKLMARDAHDFAGFGVRVSVSEDTAVIGTPFDAAARVFSTPPCLTGTVNLANDLVLDSLFVGGSTGADERTVEVRDGDLITVSMLKPLTGGSGRFVLHADVDRPSADSQALLPFGIGLTCFPFLLSEGADPVIVANDLGKRHLVGESNFYGTPTEDPPPATTTIYYPPLPLGTCLTLQGVISDPGSGSSKRVSATNAVILEVVP